MSMSMTGKWSMLTAALIVGILAASWFLLVSPKRGEASDLRTQAAAQDASNQALQQQLSLLKAQSLDLPKQKAKLAEFRTRIPDNPALPSLIRELTAAGTKVGVVILSMSPGSPEASVSAVAPVPVAAAPAATATDSTTSDSTAAGTTAAPAPAPVAAPSTLYQVPLQLTVSGSYFELEQFVNKLEGLRRSFLVTGFTLAPSPGGSANATGGTNPGDLNLSLNGQVYLAPEVAPAAAAPVAPTAAGSAPATAN
jgi:Tfp pilus assembly protein PilO